MTDLVQKLVVALEAFVERFKDHEDAGPRGETWQSDEFLAELAQARAALSEAKAGGWLPIETAPKDGTPILGWSIEYGARETRSDTYTPGSPGFAQGLTDRWWYWEEPKHNWASRWNPTHWQPLPAPPAQRGEG